MKISDAAKSAEFWFMLLLAGAVGAILFGVKIGITSNNYASAATVGKLETGVTELKTHREDDQRRLGDVDKSLDHLVRSLDGLRDQMNHWAISGHLVYVPVPAKPALSHAK